MYYKLSADLTLYVNFDFKKDWWENFNSRNHFGDVDFVPIQTNNTGGFRLNKHPNFQANNKFGFCRYCWRQNI